MRYDDQCDRFFLARFAYEIENLLLMAGIDVGRRLVGQQKSRLVGQRPGNGHTLLFAYRKLRRPMGHAVAEPHTVQKMFCPVLIGPSPRKPHG